MKDLFHSFPVIVLFVLYATVLSTAQPAAVPVDLEMPAALFSDPTLLSDDQPDPSLMETVRSLIEATPAGDTIYLSMFKFDERSLAEELVEAKQRGVVVNLILDNGPTSRETNREVREYLTGKLDRAYFLKNDISKKAIFHNKFVLFSKVVTPEGSYRRLVVQTSTNFQKKDAEKWQDMLVISHDELYTAYRNYWLTIASLGQSGSFEDYDFQDVLTSDGDFRVFFLPMRRDEKKYGEDIVVQLLERVQAPATVRMRIAMAKWDEEREDLLETIEKLAEEGAIIEILLDKKVKDKVKDQLKRIEELVIIKLKKKDVRLHAKFFLLEGEFDGVRRQFVFTGSQNFTNRSLRKNFEAFLAIENESIYRQYLEGFNRLRNYSP